MAHTGWLVYACTKPLGTLCPPRYPILDFSSPVPMHPSIRHLRTCATLYVGAGVRVMSRIRGTMPRFFFRFDLRGKPYHGRQLFFVVPQ